MSGLRYSENCLRAAEQIRSDIARRLKNGAPPGIELYNNVLREWAARPETRSLLTPYFRAQVCYIVLCHDIDTIDHAVPTEILAEWGKAIARDGLLANIEIPDDRKMRKIFSRPVRFRSRAWENQNHTHQTDSLSLPERVYAIHKRTL